MLQFRHPERQKPENADEISRIYKSSQNLTRWKRKSFKPLTIKDIDRYKISTESEAATELSKWVGYFQLIKRKIFFMICVWNKTKLYPIDNEKKSISNKHSNNEVT